MILIKLWPGFIFAVLLTTPICGVDEEIQSPSGASKPAFCAAPQYRQFDFWVGDWKVVDLGGTTRVAQVKVNLILDGCVLQEDYKDTNGSQGQSFSTFDASRKIWRQNWVTNRGKSLSIEGGLQDDSMILSGVEDTETGQTLVRGTWKPIKGGVRETAVTSIDGGKTWKPWFDFLFSPIAAHAFVGDDETTVAALDTAYQAAVRNNDAATMDRLLDDHFILVTGSGKLYTKADLLTAARDGRTHYEHQEDTAQTVRVWGDTAIVTAKLWEKGTEDGKPFDHTLWFSDTYVHTSVGWRYIFGQASSSLPSTY